MSFYLAVRKVFGHQLPNSGVSSPSCVSRRNAKIRGNTVSGAKECLKWVHRNRGLLWYSRLELPKMLARNG